MCYFLVNPHADILLQLLKYGDYIQGGEPLNKGTWEERSMNVVREAFKKTLQELRKAALRVGWLSRCQGVFY